MKRWKVVVIYNTDSGPLDVVHDIEEVGELQEIVEAGPDWHTIVDIRITLARRVSDVRTVEEARFR